MHICAAVCFKSFQSGNRSKTKSSGKVKACRDFSDSLTAAENIALSLDGSLSLADVAKPAQEVDRLVTTLERLRSGGKSILYICHRLEEVKRLCNRATVLGLNFYVAGVDDKLPQ